MPAARHLENILAHAERGFPGASAKRPAEALPLYKKFVRIEEHRVRLRHQAGGGGRQICALRVELLDVVLRHIFTLVAGFVEKQKAVSPLTVIALGGYGRGELNPFSDID